MTKNIELRYDYSQELKFIRNCINIVAMYILSIFSNTMAQKNPSFFIRSIKDKDAYSHWNRIQLYII